MGMLELGIRFSHIPYCENTTNVFFLSFFFILLQDSIGD